MSGKQSNTKISFAPYQAHPLILIAYQQAVRIFLFVYPSPHYLRGHHSWSPDGQAVSLYTLLIDIYIIY